MSTAKDWRLTHQENYLKGVVLKWQPYSPSSAENDHDHCEFCFTKFMHNEPNTLHEGFATSDRYRWICKPCFDDFFEVFA